MGRHLNATWAKGINAFYFVSHPLDPFIDSNTLTCEK